MLLVGLRDRDKVDTGHRSRVGMGHTAVRDSLGRLGLGVESRLPLLELAGPIAIGRALFVYKAVSVSFKTSRQYGVEI